MGKDVYDALPAARALFVEADGLLGFPLSSLCFVGPEEALNETYHTQPAVFVTSLALWKAIELEWSDRAAAFAGHSLGEYAALVAAGSLSFADGLRLVVERGRLMQLAGERAQGGMAAILGLDAATVEAVCGRVGAGGGDTVQVANYNCPGQTVISGAEGPLSEAMAACEKAGARKVVRLAVSIAAHSPLMAPAVEAFGEAVRSVRLRAPSCPVVGNVTAAPLLSVDSIAEELVQQLTKPVRWQESIRRLIADGAATLVEVGPGSVLTGLAKRIDRSVRRISIQGLDGIPSLAGAV